MQGYASREAALNILLEHESKGAFLKDLFTPCTSALEKPDRALVREICLGVIRNLSLLDFNIHRHAEKNPKGLLRPLLRLSAFQLFFMDVPAFAAVNVAVELAKRRAGDREAKFVNAVLNKLAKDGLQKPAGLKLRDLAVTYSHPLWMLERWHKRLGAKGMLKALERNNQEAPLWIRVNPFRANPSWGMATATLPPTDTPLPPSETPLSSMVDPAPVASVETRAKSAAAPQYVLAAQAELAALGVATETDPDAPLFLRATPVPRREIVGEASTEPNAGAEARHDARGRGGETALHSQLFADGKIAFQDPAAWLIAELADWRPGESMLDLCSAPGGKAAAVAERAGYLGLAGADVSPIVCNDLSFRRLRRIADARERLGHCNLLPLVMDPARPALRARFDLVLVDAPCSNLGVLGRRPEARWSHSPESMARLAATQTALLSQAADLVTSKGRIIYATCSPEEEETHQVVKAFLASHPGWRKVDAAGRLPAWAVRSGCLWLHPGQTEYDGFFGARLERKETAIHD